MGGVIDADVVVHCTPAVKTYLTTWDAIEVKDGILYRRKPIDEANVTKSVWQY